MTKNKKIMIQLLILFLVINIILMYPTIVAWQPIILILTLLIIALLEILACSNDEENMEKSLKGLNIILTTILVVVSVYSRFTEDLPDETLLWRWSNTIGYILLFILIVVTDCDKKPKHKKEKNMEHAKNIKSQKLNQPTINAKKGVLSDRESISCNENHELEYVLKKFGKRQTKDNIDKIKLYCQEFKKEHNSHDRKAFYEYLKQNYRLRKLKNVKKS